MPLGVIDMGTKLVLMNLSDYFQDRTSFAMLALTGPFVGGLIMLLAPQSNKGVLLFGCERRLSHRASFVDLGQTPSLAPPVPAGASPWPPSVSILSVTQRRSPPMQSRSLVSLSAIRGSMDAHSQLTALVTGSGRRPSKLKLRRITVPARRSWLSSLAVPLALLLSFASSTGARTSAETSLRRRAWLLCSQPTRLRVT